MLSEEKKKRVKEDFARFIRMEAMTMNCFQDDIEETIMSEKELECVVKFIRASVNKILHDYQKYSINYVLKHIVEIELNEMFNSLDAEFGITPKREISVYTDESNKNILTIEYGESKLKIKDYDKEKTDRRVQ